VATPDLAAAPRRDLLPAALLRLASDDRLVEQVRAGSERAFEVLFDRYHGPVLSFCRHMLGSLPDAEDAVQHTFLAAYGDLLRSDRQVKLRPWLYTIARHRCLSMLRARRERPVDGLPEPATEPLAAEVGTREDLRATLIDIERLPEDQRCALVLAELGDVSHQEIADILGCRRDKVKALLYQARSSLAHSRIARDTPCADIREQLAVVGGALRHALLRRHLRDCAGCRDFRREMRAQHRRLRALVPVVPTAALKRAVLDGASGLGAGGAAVTGALGGAGLATTAIVAVAIAGAAGATAAVSAGGADRGAPPVPPVAQHYGSGTGGYASGGQSAARRVVHVSPPDRFAPPLRRTPGGANERGSVALPAPAGTRAADLRHEPAKQAERPSLGAPSGGGHDKPSGGGHPETGSPPVSPPLSRGRAPNGGREHGADRAERGGRNRTSGGPPPRGGARPPAQPPPPAEPAMPPEPPSPPPAGGAPPAPGGQAPASPPAVPEHPTGPPGGRPGTPGGGTGGGGRP
jgi:RNA polymerase sigma factor (sigma-70 family)